MSGEIKHCSYLLSISLGPVQGFIAAGRRTRDLWFGSHALSEISRATAQKLKQLGAKLIFPPSDDVSNVANVLLAELPEGDPKVVAQQAKDAARQKWREFAKEALKVVNKEMKTQGGAPALVDLGRFWGQVDDVIEFYAAWVPLEGDYSSARQRLMRILAGRKQCRDFEPAKGIFGLPKSSLDGARETIWRDGKAPASLPRRLAVLMRLRSGEQLDAVGLVKRLAGGEHFVPSVSRIAGDPWLRGARSQCRDLISKLRKECERLAKESLIGRVKWKQFESFPYEGVIVYRDRHRDLAKQGGVELSEFDLAGQILKDLEDTLKGGPPSPYLAVIKGDGDRMGRAISRIHSPDVHRRFSSSLAEFATRAREIVAQHHGWLVYSGGDDVLAFLPVDEALQCARRLHDDFASSVKQAIEQQLGPGLDDLMPTLSIGVAVGHFMEPMEDLLHYAEEAEKAAKQATPGRPGTERDGLAVHYHPRGGAPLCVRAQWKEGLDKELLELATLHRAGEIPDKAGFDLLELIREYDGMPEAVRERALPVDAERLLARKRGGAQLIKMVREAGTAAGIEELARRIVLARIFAHAAEQAARPLGSW